MNTKRFISFLLTGVVAIGASGCASVKRMAVNQIGDAIAGGGTSYASDEDPELIKAASPFGLKLVESLLAESPNNRNLLLTASSGFTQYAYAFVQEDAEELGVTNVAASLVMRQRARRLYLRARDYGLRGLEVAHPGFTNALYADAQAAVKTLRKRDVPLAYWTAASWAAAVAIIKDDPGLISDLPRIQALMGRALELNETYDHGAIHTFLIAFDMSRPLPENERVARARAQFQRAVQLSDARQAAPFVSLAENVAVQQQDRKEFESSLNRALAMDVNTKSQWRLANLIMQRRARWLLTQEDNLIENDAEPQTNQQTCAK